jgi:hypothetical protein
METISFEQKWISAEPPAQTVIVACGESDLSHTILFLKQSLIVVNGTKDPAGG